MGPTGSQTETKEYILGTDAQELERLRFQHQVWVKEAYALFERAGLRAGHHVLDIGCGPGFVTLELAHVVGPHGRIVASDQSARFLDVLRRECARLGRMQVQPCLGPVEELDLAPRSLDAAYARWLFCWLADPSPVLERVARALKPGGALLLQEYLDWGAMSLIPASAAFARVVEACLASWKAGGATIDFTRRVPELAAAHGFTVEHFAPRARLGMVGSLEWRWIDQFLREYLPKVETRGLLRADEREAWQREWEQRTAEGASWVTTPTVADVILRKR